MWHSSVRTNMSIAFCYEYGWVSQDLGTGPSIIDCRIESGQTIYHCVNYPVSAIDRYLSLLQDVPLSISKECLVDRLATDACLNAIRQGISVGHGVLKTYVSRVASLGIMSNACPGK